MKPLNLASQPFRNERLGEALFAAGSVALLALTAWHALVIRDLLPARTSALHQEVAALDAERARLRQEGRDRRTETPPAPVLAQWTLVKDLVDRRAFSWAGLFASLEQVIPDDVRLNSLPPAVRKGQVELQVSATVRNASAGWEFVRALEESEEFYDVYPTSEAEREFEYKMRYRPRHEREMVGPPPPGSEEGEVGPPVPSPAPSATAPPLVGPPEPGKGRE